MEIILFIIVVIIIRLIAGILDSDRTQDEVIAKGGKLISQTWTPFGKGWFGAQYDRIYEVVYLDKEGNKHKATVKTSMFSGVYFTDDQIIECNQQSEVSNEDKLALQE